MQSFFTRFSRGTINRCHQPGPITFFVEAFTFEKDPADTIGFYVSPTYSLLLRPWTPLRGGLLVENKFDSKEGPGVRKGDAVCDLRAKGEGNSLAGSIWLYFFTTKTGESAFGETGFCCRQLYRCVKTPSG